MQNSEATRYVFYVSDRTGKTAESIGQSLLSQFNGFVFKHMTFSFVNTEEEAREIAERIQRNAITTGKEPLVFSTLVDERLGRYFTSLDACVISLFRTFIAPLETSLGVASSHTMGKPHEEFDDEEYQTRINAIDFSLGSDDGVRVEQFSEADVILLGVSRSAKTPTCLYLALNFSIKAANYPLTEDDLAGDELPPFLVPFRDKIVGLTIKPEQLSAIREQRRPKSEYASLKKCREEIRKAGRIMNGAGIPVFDSTSMSIEEIAVKIVQEKNLLRARD